MIFTTRRAHKATATRERKEPSATPSQPSRPARQRTDSMSSVKTIRPASKSLKHKENTIERGDSVATSERDTAQRTTVAPAPQRGRAERRARSSRKRSSSPAVDRKTARCTDAPTNTAPLSAEQPLEFPTFTSMADAVRCDDEDLEVVDMDLDSSDSDDDPFKYDNDYVVVDSSVFSLAAAKARIALLARSLVPTFQEAWREGNALFNKTWTPARFGLQLRSMEKYNIFWDVQTCCMQVRGEVMIDDRILLGSTVQTYRAPPVRGLTFFFWPAVWDNCAPASTLSARAHKRDYLAATWRGCPVFSDSLIRADGAAMRVDAVCVQGPWQYVANANAPGARVTRPAFTLQFALDVPTDLFAHVDFRLVRVRAVAAFECTDDDGRTCMFEVESPVADFAVEHLRKERHMDGSKLLHPST